MSQQRNMLRVMRRQLEKDNRDQPIQLRQMPKEQWRFLDDSTHTKVGRIEVWRSYKYLVQVFQEDRGVLRVSVNAAKLTRTGRWHDGLTWDELQEIKRQIGRGGMQAIELYPADADVVNVANMRHLWILPMPIKVGWNQ